MTLRKEPFECRDDAAHGVDRVSHDRVDTQVVADPIGIREYYVQGNPLHLHARWWIWERHTDVKQVCARFDWLLTYGEVDGPTLKEDEAVIANGWCEYQDGAVFVDVVEFRDEIHGVIRRRAGVSLVWLRFLDRCELVTRIAKPVSEETIELVVLKLRTAFKDRKLGLLSVVGVLRAVKDELAHQMVEAGPQLMNHVADNNSDLRAWFNKVGAEFRVPLLMSMEEVRAKATWRIVTVTDCGFEIEAMFLGPFYFQPEGVYYRAHRIHDEETNNYDGRWGS